MHFIAILDGKGGVWGVRIPDLPGCHGGGPTPEAAILDATSAAKEWLDHRLSRGLSVPKAHGIDEIRNDPDAEFDPGSEALVLIPAEVPETV